MARLRVLLWNVEWASPRSERGKRLRAQWLDDPPDLLCLTESAASMLPDHGHAITAGADYGYPHNGTRRKVLLWSPRPWSEADAVGDAMMPSGRYVAGVTGTSLGAVAVHGVCIPWAAAHVSTGHRNRTRWEDHLAYLEGLRRILDRPAAHPRLVLGDYNQRIPRRYTPERVFAALERTFASLRIATAGPVDGLEALPIDHLAHDPALRATSVEGIPRKQDGVRLSDHDGLRVTLEAIPADS